MEEKKKVTEEEAHFMFEEFCQSKVDIICLCPGPADCYEAWLDANNITTT